MMIKVYLFYFIDFFLLLIELNNDTEKTMFSYWSVQLFRIVLENKKTIFDLFYVIDLIKIQSRLSQKRSVTGTVWYRGN